MLQSICAFVTPQIARIYPSIESNQILSPFSAVQIYFFFRCCFCLFIINRRDDQFLNYSFHSKLALKFHHFASFCVFPQSKRFGRIMTFPFLYEWVYGMQTTVQWEVGLTAIFRIFFGLFMFFVWRFRLSFSFLFRCPVCVPQLFGTLIAFTTSTITTDNNNISIFFKFYLLDFNGRRLILTF